MEELAKEYTEGDPIVPPAIAERMGGQVMPSGLTGTKQDALRKLTGELSADSEGYVPAQALQALDSGDAEAALKLCDSFAGEVSSVTPLSVPLIRGRALLALERVNEAAEEFHRILRLEPESPAALKGLGDTYFAQNKEVIAFTYYERARELSGAYQALAEPIRFVTPAPQPEPTAESTSAPTSAPTSVSVAEPVSEAPVALAEVSSDEMTHEEVGLAEGALEEIVVQESCSEETGETAEVDEAAEVAHVSLTLKRSSEDCISDNSISENSLPESSAPESNTPDNNSPERAESQQPGETPVSEFSVSKPQAPVASVRRTRVEPTERFDRPQRPAHYQTETMADLLLQQGHTDAALGILRVLVKENPLPRLQEKLSTAEKKRKRPR